MNKLAVAIIASLLLCSCGIGTARVNRQMDSWIGQNQNELLAKWGPPDSVYEDADNKIFLYRENKSGTTPGSVMAVPLGSGVYAAQTVGGQNYSYETKRMFWINKDGVITKTAWKGI